MRALSLTLMLLLLNSVAGAQNSTSDFASEETKGPRPDQKLTSEIRIGVVVVAEMVCRGINATVPVPIELPEQRVKIVKEDITPSVKNVTYRGSAGLVRQMSVVIPTMPARDEARALITFEVTRTTLKPPSDTSIFVLASAKKLKPDIKAFLTPSPYIETQNVAIRGWGKELFGAKDTAWEKIEALYDGTRAKIEFRNGPLKGAAQSFKDGFGDKEELCSVFICACRQLDVPARMVWVEGHCYVEFYLEDGEGKGYWIPCNVAGEREFGGISDGRPILMKGDNFRTSEKPEPQRFVAPWLTGSGGKPQVQFFRELIGAPAASK